VPVLACFVGVAAEKLEVGVSTGSVHMISDNISISNA
jgi:hypothetical protein